MNVINENMYMVLEKIYRDFDKLFQPDIFHMGGDEVSTVIYFRLTLAKVWNILKSPLFLAFEYYYLYTT